MDYEKKHKEAQGWIEKIYPTLQHEQQMEAEAFFPELAESEDERVRKELIVWLKNSEGQTLPIDRYNAALAWLEKQGEQKSIWHNEDEEPKRGSLILLIMQSGTPIVAKIIEPNHTFNHGERWAYIDDLLEKQAEVESDNDDIEVEEKGIKEAFNKIEDEKQGEHKSTDKVEPKFNVGVWIVNNVSKDVFLIKSITDGYYNGYYTLEDTEGNISFPCLPPDESAFRLWTLKDAKDGDALVNGSNIFIFHFINGTRLMGYCHVNIDDGRFYDDIGKNECFCLINGVVNPATKEQREQLEKAMADAGYAFDFDKKKLKKIEQKPAEWSEEDEVKINRIVACLENLNVADNDILLKDVDWLKSLKTRYTWKPSDEQMEALDDAVRLYKSTHFDSQHYKIESLYEDLKKLKGE